MKTGAGAFSFPLPRQLPQKFMDGYYDPESGDWIDGGDYSSDSGSAVGSWLGGLASLGNTANGIISSLNPASPPATQPKTTSSSMKAYLPWILGGAVVVVLLLALTRR